MFFRWLRPLPKHHMAPGFHGHSTAAALGRLWGPGSGDWGSLVPWRSRWSRLGMVNRCRFHTCLIFFGGKRASLPYIYHYLLSNMALWRWEQPGRTKIRKIMVDRSQQHSRLRGFFGRDVLWWKSSASAAKIDWGPSSVGCCVGMATWTEPNFGASKIQRS